MNGIRIACLCSFNDFFNVQVAFRRWRFADIISFICISDVKEVLSASEKTATDKISISLQVRMMRMAISPRLATRIFLICFICGNFNCINSIN